MQTETPRDLRKQKQPGPRTISTGTMAETRSDSPQKRTRGDEDDDTAEARDGQIDVDGSSKDVGPMPVEDVPKKKRRGRLSH
jgi:hypothetical protein